MGEEERKQKEKAKKQVPLIFQLPCGMIWRLGRRMIFAQLMGRLSTF